tara:strand:+ start:243 stop:449 length:207 start_codon:yes stop_codon:yes gene_type:complete
MEVVLVEKVNNVPGIFWPVEFVPFLSLGAHQYGHIAITHAIVILLIVLSVGSSFCTSAQCQIQFGIGG